MMNADGNGFSLSTLIGARKPGLTLEQPFYNSSRIFEIDLERIHLRHWQFVGHVSRLPRPGDYFLYSLAGESVVIVRDRDGEIHALLNVCRHRGSRICSEEEGSVKRFVCPYHAWTYGLDGSLLSARHMPDDFDRAEFPLHRCQVRVVEGLIFICLAESPPPFDSLERDISTLFAPHGWPAAKTCARIRHVIRANWKLVAENFFECYHCIHTHPELTTVMGYVRAGESKRFGRELDRYTSRWKREICRTGHDPEPFQRPAGIQQHGGRRPIRPGYLTQSRTGQPLAPLMGDYDAYDGGVSSIMFFPINWLVAGNDYGMATRFTPLSPQETEAELTWLVHPDAVEGVDYDPDEVTWLWHKTLEEDKEICENNQAGVNSRYYRPGPYSTTEETVDRFCQWYLDELEVDSRE